MPALFPDKNKTIIDINVQNDPTEEELPAILSTYDNRKYTFPVKSYNLPSSEVLFVNRGKLRPGIILTFGFTRWPSQPSEQMFLCVPLYTVDKAKIRPEFVIETQAFHHPSKFYVPPHPTYHIAEAVARFEFIQAVDIYALKAYQECGHSVMLTGEFFALLKIQVTRFFGGIVTQKDQDDLLAYGEIVLDEAEKQGIKV